MKTAKHYKISVIEGDNIPAQFVRNSTTAADFIRQFYFDDIEIYESFFMLTLNRQNLITGYVKISQGGTMSTVVDPKIVAKYAIDTFAAGVIIAHNHPSGKLAPSDADKEITKKIAHGLMLFDIKVLDHIILTKDGHFSFQDEGLIY